MKRTLTATLLEPNPTYCNLGLIFTDREKWTAKFGGPVQHMVWQLQSSIQTVQLFSNRSSLVPTRWQFRFISFRQLPLPMKCASISVHDRTKKSEKVHKMKIHLPKFVSSTKSSKITMKMCQKSPRFDKKKRELSFKLHVYYRSPGNEFVL